MIGTTGHLMELEMLLLDNLSQQTLTLLQRHQALGCPSGKGFH